MTFIATQCNNFDTVYLVLGNHEFYGISRSEGLARADMLEKEAITMGRLKVLHRKRIDVNESLCILGCTLQSHVRPQSRLVVSQRIKDFQRIADWTVDQHNEEHYKDLEWLLSEIRSINVSGGATSRPKNLIVVTHHAPIKKGSSHPSNENNPWADGFATDLVGVHKELSRAQWWVFGHTHYTTKWREHGVELVSNQRGYVLNPSLEVHDPDMPQYQTAWKRTVSLFTRRSHRFDPRKCIQVKT